MQQRKLTLAQAQQQYVHRFTMQYKPAWANKPICEKFPAPQYASDQEWYDNTVFPGEGHIHRNARYCEAGGQTWPLGKLLDAPFQVGA